MSVAEQRDDLVPVASAVATLVRASVTSDEQLHEYAVAQALRSLAHAVCGTVADARGVLAQLAKAATASPSGRDVACYASMRLLLDDETAYGEGNDRPSCRARWPQTLVDAAKELLQWEAGCVDRRLQLGYVVLVADLLRGMQQQRAGAGDDFGLCTSMSLFAIGLLTDVVPQCAALAEGTRDETRSTRQPSLLTVAANSATIAVFAAVASDVLRAESRIVSKKSPSKLAVVIDLDIQQPIWTHLSAWKNALQRMCDWIDREMNQSDSSLLSRTFRALDDALTKFRKQRDELDYLAAQTHRQFGEHAKDSHAVASNLWLVTLQLCALVAPVSSAFVCAVDSAAARDSSNNALHKGSSLLVDCLSMLAAIKDPNEAASITESDTLRAAVMLLTVSFAIGIRAPTRDMQRDLIEENVEVTQQMHQLIVSRVLQFKDDSVLRLGSALSTTILDACGSDGSSSNVGLRMLDVSGDQLIEMLATSRDAAAHCVIDIVARAAILRPYSTIPLLFRLLKQTLPSSTATASSENVCRKNALDVLARLPAVVPEAESEMSAAHRDVLRLLCENLLVTLEDDELFSRMQTASLFGRLVPADCTMPLLLSAMRRDTTGNRRGAATAALKAMVVGHANSADAVVHLVECAAEVSATQSKSAATSSPLASAAPTTPGEIASFVALHCAASLVTTDEGDGATESATPAVTGSVTRLVLDCCRAWSERVTDWTDKLLRPVVNLVCRSQQQPSSAAHTEIAVKTVVALVAHVAERGGISVLVQLVVEKLRERSGVTADEASGALVLCRRDAPEAVVFCAVAPLLCLRPIPRSLFVSAAVTLHELFALLERFCHPACVAVTHTEVMRLLLELRSKFPVRDVLLVVGDDDASRDAFRVVLFTYSTLMSTCQGLLATGTVDGAESKQVLEKAAPVCSRALKFIKAQLLLLLESDESEEAGGEKEREDAKLLGACFDALGVTVVSGLLHEEAYNAFPVWKALGLEDCSRVRTGSTDHGSPIAVTIAVVVRVNISALRVVAGHPSCHQLTTAWLRAHLAPTVSLSNACCAAGDYESSCSLTTLLFNVVMCGRQKGPATAASAAAGGGGGGGEERRRSSEGESPSSLRLSREDAVALVSYACGCAGYAKSPALQFEGVKLLSAVMAVDPAAFGHEGKDGVQRALLALSGVANIHPLPAARMLAEQVLDVVTRAAAA